MPLATFRRGDWREEDSGNPYCGRADGSMSRSSLVSEDSMSSRSRTSLQKWRRKLRQSKSARSMDSCMLKVLSESQPDFQAQRVVGYSMELGEDDYQVFAEGLLHGSLFGAAWGESELLATLASTVELFTFNANEPVGRKEAPLCHIFVIRDGQFFLAQRTSERAPICLGVGCVFGELELFQLAGDEISAGPAGGTCFAISKESFLDALKKMTRKASSEVFQLLLGSELFRYLDSSYVAMLSKCSYSMKYQDKALIRKDGIDPDFVYIVKSGNLIESGQLLLTPGDCVCRRPGAPLHAEGEVEVLAIPVTSLQSVMGFRGHDFLWRCELLHILRSRWSHHLSFGPWMAQRGDPEAWARACVILTLHVEVMQEFLRSHSSSIRWLMLLDGAHNGAHIKVGDQVLHTDAEIWSPGVLAIEPLPSSNSGFALGSSSNTVTIAVLLNDAMLPGEAGALEEKLTLVKRVFLFRTLDDREQQLLADASRLVSRRCGEMVFREGEMASQCFVVAQGEMAQSKEGRVMRTLGAFSSFGEQELLSQLPRNFSVSCKTDTATLMAIDKMVFEHVVKERVFAQLQDQLQLRRVDIHLDDLQEISTLGYGTYGIVRLVEHQSTGARYALKCISRNEAVARRQQASICAEREILTDVDHPFILKLVRTFKDHRNVYFLTEFVTGGELFNAIRSLGILSGVQARFYTGSLILALQALHEKKIIYRDLKPENVLLDNYGYIKLIDFGCAVRFDQGSHRSLVGTPHYMAPEVILGKEYHFSCDVWSLGVCLYEFVCGPLPFGQDCEDPRQVFQDILLSKLYFPEHFINTPGKHLLRCLLRKNSRLRIGGEHGLQDVREHAYFRKFSFTRLLGRNLEPPLVSSKEVPSDEDVPSLTRQETPHRQETGGDESFPEDDWAAEF
ncbi:unnamed protein product [Durusdinium trenchii]|uniref:cGMP-dependent protein kinase n=1 Tax=Durusdinium trenchii TaxID=1381693 RepID=A0ABP0NAV7_9DINO